MRLHGGISVYLGPNETEAFPLLPEVELLSANVSDDTMIWDSIQRNGEAYRNFQAQKGQGGKGGPSLEHASLGYGFA